MPNMTGATASAFLQLFLNATTWASVAQNVASSPATQFYISLHNANPGVGGSQTTNETAYTNYARISVVRTTSGWTVSGSNPVQYSNAGVITFAQCGATGDTITHWGVGLSASGAGTLYLSGPVGSGPILDFTATSASPGVFTIPSGSFVANNRVSFYGNAAGTLPAGLTEGVVYFIGTVTGSNYTLSTTSGNANPVNTTSVGAGYAIGQSPLAISSGITPSFAANTLIGFLG